MPPQDPNSQKDKTNTPNPTPDKSVPNDNALREDWNKLSREDKNRYFSNLSAEDQVKFGNRVGLFDSKEPIGISPHPSTGSVPWMKEKAYSLLNWGVNQIPNVEGALGGFIGGTIGEAASPAGAALGELSGSALGGAKGEYDRQRLVDMFNLDPYAQPTTTGQLMTDMAKSGENQMVATAIGLGAGRLMRPTLERSIAKLSNAGGISYGDGMGEGNLKTVINDLMATEKAQGGKAITIQDFVNTINKTKEDNGKIVDASYNAPVMVGGKQVMLGDVAPNPTPLVDLIRNFSKKNEGLIKRASLTGNDPRIQAAHDYMQMIKDRALTFEQKPWTYRQLADERIDINGELSSYYAMTPGEKQAFLNAHPLFEVDKAIADHIRDVTYPEMDKAAGFPPGTTKKLQERRGILRQIDTEVRKNLDKLQTTTLQAKGEGLVDKISPSAYLTSEGKPGGSAHRIQRLIHTPNGVASANKKVSQAFGHAPITVLRKKVTTPLGSENLGNEILSMPIRALNPWGNPIWEGFEDKHDQPPPDDEATPQSSAVKPKELIERAKKLNPSAQGQVAYAHTAVNPDTGHKIGSNGKGWFDVQTGQQVV